MSVKVIKRRRQDERIRGLQAQKQSEEISNSRYNSIYERIKIP